MTYEYRKSAAEKKAEELLRSKGWHVNAPLCPDCHGWGWVYKWETLPMVDGSWMSSASHPCRFGCPPPAASFFSSRTLSNVVIRNNTIADGTQGMRRGE